MRVGAPSHLITAHLISLVMSARKLGKFIKLSRGVNPKEPGFCIIIIHHTHHGEVELHVTHVSSVDSCFFAYKLKKIKDKA